MALKMALDAENLRRSKRNKFHLDVAAIHMVHPERRRTQPGRLTPSSDGAGSRRAASLSPAHQGSPVHSEADEEERGKRVRRVPVRNASYVYDDDSDEDESLRIHKRVHDRYGVGPAVDMKVLKFVKVYFMCSTPNETRSSDSASPDIGGSPPQLSPAVSTHATSLIRSHTEPGRLVALSLPKTTLKRTTVVATQLSTSPSKNPSSPSNIATQRSPGRRRRKCPQCPFTARTTTRMERHMIGHSKETGFQCSLCNFKSVLVVSVFIYLNLNLPMLRKTESAGFLKRHVEVHGVTSFSWPPQYVGISPRPRKPASIARTKGEARNGRITASPAKVLPLFSLREGTGGLRCPIDGCTFATRLLPQMVCHKMKCHPDARDKRRSLFPCKKCGARLRTAGALRVHRLARHVRVRHPKTIQFFMRERVGMHFVSSRAINHTRLRTERSSTNNEFKTGKEAKEEAIDMDESSSSLPITCQLDSSIE
uniref:C2H2-type domain-containing protein n=1 Tax=Heterorhabditis bacteriophora TaxID=37862 RepID=A0A1I7XQR1_HETBA